MPYNVSVYTKVVENVRNLNQLSIFPFHITCCIGLRPRNDFLPSSSFLRGFISAENCEKRRNSTGSLKKLREKPQKKGRDGKAVSRKLRRLLLRRFMRAWNHFAEKNEQKKYINRKTRVLWESAVSFLYFLSFFFCRGCPPAT